MSLTPFCRVTSIMLAQSAEVTAIGFSQSTCRPARAARSVYCAVHRIGQRDVDRVDLAALEELVGIVVAADAVNAVTAGELPELFRVIGDQSRQCAVRLRLREGGKDGDLRDVSEADDGVSNLLSGGDALTGPAGRGSAWASAGSAPEPALWVGVRREPDDRVAMRSAEASTVPEGNIPSLSGTRNRPGIKGLGSEIA